RRPESLDQQDGPPPAQGDAVARPNGDRLRDGLVVDELTVGRPEVAHAQGARGADRELGVYPGYDLRCPAEMDLALVPPAQPDADAACLVARSISAGHRRSYPG